MTIQCMLFIFVILPCVSATNNVEEPVYSSYQFDLSYDDINISSGCSEALRKLFMLESTHSSLMLRYWDSWGKPSHGILEGHTSYLGYYDECINLKDTEFGETDYCVYPMQMNISTIPTPIAIQVGICFPSGCSSQEFATILSEMDMTSVVTVAGNPFSLRYNDNFYISINSSNMSTTYCPQTDEDYDVSAIVALIFCGVAVVMVIISTTVDIVFWLLSTDLLQSHEIFSKFSGNIQASDKDNSPVGEKGPLILKPGQQKSDRPTVKDFILSFSLYNTVPVLVSMKPSPSAIKAVSGIRCHAITLIAICHVAFYPFFLPGLLQNPQYSVDLVNRFLFQPISNISLVVETFFLIGAFLSSYLTFKDIEKHGRFRYLYFYLHRYSRISPLLYFYTIISIKLIYHFAQGPLWHFPILASCKDYWWHNLLYIGNLLQGESCYGIVWYLFVDMQLYILSPIIILLLYHYRYVGLMMMALVMIGVTTGIGLQAGMNDDYRANLILHQFEYIEPINDLYGMPHYRVNTYLIGILLGYIFYKKYWLTNLSINKCLTLLIYVVLWVAAIVLCTTTMFGAYKDDDFSKFQTVIYLMFNGPAWSTGLSIMIYICNTGYGGVVNSYLSWSVWEPLAKLSYGVYLCHVIVISIMFSTFQSTLISTDYVYAIMCVFTMVTSFACSAVTFVCLELPISKVVSLGFKLFGVEDRQK